MKLLSLILGGALALAMQASAQIASPWQQQIGFTPSPDLPAVYVFYCGTNSGEYQHRIAFTNTAWAIATNELQVGVWKTNFIGGVTNYITATSAVIQGTNLVEGLPAVEINFVPPRPPVLKLTAEILQSSEASGPWSLFTNLPPIELVADGHRRFYQARMKVQ